MGYTLLPPAIGTLFMNQVSQKPYPIGWHIHPPPPPHFKIRSVGPGTRRICIRQCFSYYAPGARPRKDLTDKRVKYCDTCKPSLRSWTKVSLNCPGAKHPHVDKLVEVIHDCTCQKCVKDSKSKHRTHRK